MNFYEEIYKQFELLIFSYILILYICFPVAKLILTFITFYF